MADQPPVEGQTAEQQMPLSSQIEHNNNQNKMQSREVFQRIMIMRFSVFTSVLLLLLRPRGHQPTERAAWPHSPPLDASL